MPFIYIINSNYADMYKVKFYFILLALFFLVQSCEKDKRPGLPTDGDGNTYDTIVLGTQVWLTENLKTTKYNDGYAIPLVEDDEFWSATGRPAYCWYLNEPYYKDSYGALYNFWAAQLHEYICPVGYHVATEEDWNTLAAYLLDASSDVRESFKTIHTGVRNWDGSFAKYSYSGWWVYSSQSGTSVSTSIPDSPEFHGFGRGMANMGLSIRCVKTRK